MGNELANLTVIPGSRRRKRRVGRGIASGRGKTCGRGTKGQRSRSGSGVRPGFEGGQMPLQRRVPKRGFVNVFKEQYDIVNVRALEQLDGVDVVDPSVLRAAGIISGRRKVKILSCGELTKPFTVRAHKFSAQAIAKIEACGGKVEVL